ncbi:Hypothetical protein POVN_LOCUS146 [uncultured virus]|nr:Hypothetical protein POVN_LOCUS146 [uncultured virus]
MERKNEGFASEKHWSGSKRLSSLVPSPVLEFRRKTKKVGTVGELMALLSKVDAETKVYVRDGKLLVSPRLEAEPASTPSFWTAIGVFRKEFAKTLYPRVKTEQVDSYLLSRSAYAYLSEYIMYPTPENRAAVEHDFEAYLKQRGVLVAAL